MSRRPAPPRDRAIARSDCFRVDWGGPPGEEGFLRVEFPELSPDRHGGELLLARLTGTSTALYDWFRDARPARAAQPPGRAARPAQPRDLRVTIMADAAPMLTFLFEGCFPVRYGLSPLDARLAEPHCEMLWVFFSAMHRLP